MKVLLACDSSEHSKALIAEAVNRPWPEGTELRAFTVIDLFALTYGLGYVESFSEKESEAAKSFIEGVAERLQANPALKVSHSVVEGYPSTAIVDQANEWGADLIMIGSHGHSGLVRFFVGSVAKAVVHNASCSVEIVRPSSEKKEKDGRRVLVATDGSESSLNAVKMVAAFKWPAATEVRAVSVAEVFIGAIDPWYTTGDMMEQIREASLTQARDAVKETSPLLSEAGLNVSTDVLIGSAKARIVEEADEWGADLLVVGSHGRRGLTRVLLGSVSEAVAMRAHCSVLVVRTPGSGND